MPYINEVNRGWLDKAPVHSGKGNGPQNAGELNYVFTRIALDYIARFGESYHNYSDVIAAFEAAKLEFYRRNVAPYEDRKIDENGDIERGY